MLTNWDAHIDAFLPEDGFEGRWWDESGVPMWAVPRSSPSGRAAWSTSRMPQQRCRLSQCKKSLRLGQRRRRKPWQRRAIAANGVAGQQDNTKPWFLSPSDLQAHKHVA